MYFKSILAVGCIISLSIIPNPSEVQEEAPAVGRSQAPGAAISTNTAAQEAEPAEPDSGFPGLAQGSSPIRYFGNSAEREMDQKIGEAAKNLRQAKTEQDRMLAKETLTSLLSEDYDARLETYDEYLIELEKKLSEMRKQLQKRREAKLDMIQLRIRVLEAEAEDLGWPKRMSNRFPSSLRTFTNGQPAWGRSK